MPQVGPAVGALDLGPPHEQTAIRLFIDAFLPDRRPETRPARPGVVLRVRGEWVSPTDDADVHTRVVVVPVFSGEGPLGPFVDADVVLQRRELLPKLRLVELLHEEGRAPRVLRFRLAPELKSTDGVAWSPGGYICGALGFCCQRAKRVPEGSSKMANHPWPGTSFFGATILPPAFLIFSTCSSTEFTKM